MFGLTKREQRWAAEQKAAETIVPLFTAAIEARTAMDTNECIAALEAELAKVKADYAALQASCDTAALVLAEMKAERDAAVVAERDRCVDIINAYATVCDRSPEMLMDIARGAAHE